MMTYLLSVCILFFFLITTRWAGDADDVITRSAGDADDVNMRWGAYDDEVTTGFLGDWTFVVTELVYLTGDDVTGDDLTGDDVTGDDLTGDDVTGDDLKGDDVTGDDLTGDDLTGDDATGDDLTGDDVTISWRTSLGREVGSGDEDEEDEEQLADLIFNDFAPRYRNLSRMTSLSKLCSRRCLRLTEISDVIHKNTTSATHFSSTISA